MVVRIRICHNELVKNNLNALWTIKRMLLQSGYQQEWGGLECYPEIRAIPEAIVMAIRSSEDGCWSPVGNYAAGTQKAGMATTIDDYVDENNIRYEWVEDLRSSRSIV